MRFDKADWLTVLLLCQRAMYFVDLLQIKDKFHYQETIGKLLYMGCPLMREPKQKKNPIFIFKSARVCLRESVRLRNV